MWDLDAVICTCDIISRDSSFDKRWRQLSRQFLDELSEERVLLLGMLADASDELLQLVRFFDKEAFAIEKMAEKVQSFKQTVQVLFHHGACLRTGFTKLCLAHLRMQKAVRDGSGRVRMIGGPAFDLEALSKRCLQRMSAWSKVVHEVAATEFPEWELLGAFSAFRLAEPGTRAAGPAAARPPPSCPGRGVRDCLQQLASAFGITDPAGLCLEFQNHQRLAQGHKNMFPDTSDADAWRHALASTQRNHNTRHLWSAKALRPVLERFFVCPGSTAGIEQVFSLFKRIMGEQWHGSEEAEERRLILSIRARREPNLSEKLLADARRIWQENFGPARRRSHPCLGTRARVLLKRRRTQPQGGAAGWREQRRLATARAASEFARGISAATRGRAPSAARSISAAERGEEEESGAGAWWTEKHEAEVQHQRREHHERACAAVEEGTACRTSALGDPASAAAAMRAFQKKDTDGPGSCGSSRIGSSLSGQCRSHSPFPAARACS